MGDHAMELELDLGKCYRTRDGRKATDVNGDGVLTATVDGCVFHYTDDGKVMLNVSRYRMATFGGDHPLDLIAEWTEPDDGWGEWVVDALGMDRLGKHRQIEYDANDHYVRHRVKKPKVETVPGNVYWSVGGMGFNESVHVTLTDGKITAVSLDGAA